jgi:hypothetical protein
MATCDMDRSIRVTKTHTEIGPGTTMINSPWPASVRMLVLSRGSQNNLLELLTKPLAEYHPQPSCECAKQCRHPGSCSILTCREVLGDPMGKSSANSFSQCRHRKNCKGALDMECRIRPIKSTSRNPKANNNSFVMGGTVLITRHCIFGSR